jgi:hypothetical protein
MNKPESKKVSIRIHEVSKSRKKSRIKSRILEVVCIHTIFKKGMSSYSTEI